MSQPTLFIGSSKESKWIADEISKILSKEIEVRVWNKGTFHLGDYPLESLRREILRSDYALLIVHPDDKIRVREKQGYTTRDNVLFELGLFAGVLGRHRGFCLAVNDERGKDSKNVNIPSDITGLMRLNITLTKNKQEFRKSLKNECESILNAIDRAQDSIGLNLLPSTSLAIGYFNNFVLQVCQAVSQSSDFKVNDRSFDLTNGKFDFVIVLPNKGADASHEGFLKFVNRKKLQRVEVEGKTKSRRFPFFVDSEVHKGRILLYDYPTTLRAAREAISLAIPKGTTSKEIEILEKREIANFEKTLEHLISQNPESALFRDNVSIMYVDKLK